MDLVRIVPGTPRDSETIVTVLYPQENGPTPLTAKWQAGADKGELSVRHADARQDTLLFTRGGQGKGPWQLLSVNGEDASQIPDGTGRVLRPVQ